MHAMLKTTMVGLLALTLSTGAASAKSWHDDWDDRHHGWNDRWDRDDWKDYKSKGKYGHHNNITIYSPPPYRNDVYISNYRHVPPGHVYTHNYPSNPYRNTSVRCVDTHNPLGGLLGGVAGGIIGNNIGKGNGRTAAIISGTIIGGAIGHGVSSRHCTTEVFHDTPIGMPITWQNASEYYEVTPTREYRTAGRYCREYQAIAQVAGRSQQTYGTACMQPDGSWEVIN